MFNRIMLVVLFLGTVMRSSAGAESLDELKAKYLSLRNTDVAVTKPAEWEALSRQLVEFADSNPDHPGTTLALLESAILNQSLYEKYSSTDKESGLGYVIRALKTLQTIETDYAGDSLADDAIIRKGDIFLSLGDVKLARNNYDRVLSRYTDGDMTRRASQKIALLEQTSTTADEVDAASPARKNDRPLIVIDPGHGGEDFGAKSPKGALEKHLVLETALLLEKLLKEKGFEVRLTRRDDLFVPLAERTNFANKLDATIFISLHANASPGGRASGFETYYLDNSGDAASKSLAERENSSLEFEESAGDIQFILSDLIQNAKAGDSIALANLLNRAVVKNLQPKWPQARSLGVRKAPFYVLVGAHMPCVLVELFFIDSPIDSELLSDQNFKKELVQGLSNGIGDFLATVQGVKKSVN